MYLNFYFSPVLFLLFNYNFKYGTRSEVVAMTLESGFISSMEIMDPLELNRPRKTSIIYLDSTDEPLFLRRHTKRKKKNENFRGRKVKSLRKNKTHTKAKNKKQKGTGKGSKGTSKGSKGTGKGSNWKGKNDKKQNKSPAWKSWKTTNYGGNSKISGSKSAENEKRNPVDIIVHIKMKE